MTSLCLCKVGLILPTDSDIDLATFRCMFMKYQCRLLSSVGNFKNARTKNDMKCRRYFMKLTLNTRSKLQYFLVK